MMRREADHEGLRDGADENEQDAIGEAGSGSSPSGENAYGSGRLVGDTYATRPPPPPPVPPYPCPCHLCQLARLYPGRGLECPS